MKFDLTVALPYEPLSEEDKVACERIMRRGNVPLRYWHRQAMKRLRNKQYAHQRIALLEKKLRTEPPRPEWQKELAVLMTSTRHYNRTKFRCDLLNRMGKTTKAVVIWGLRIPKKDMEKIAAVKAIESKVLLAFSRMISTVVFRWANQDQDVAASPNDLYNEGVVAAIRASFCFTKKDTRFSTYVYHAIRRRIMTVCMRSQPLSAYPAAAIELLREYRVVQQRANGHTTHDEILREMGLTRKHKETLEAMLVGVIHQADLLMLSCPGGEESHNNDFTQVGMCFAGLDGNKEWFTGGHSGVGPILSKRTGTEIDITKAVEQIRGKASELEVAVLEGFLKNHQGAGWMTEVAKNLVNPKTSQPYSRMSVTFAWRRVREMFVDALGLDRDAFLSRLEDERKERGEIRDELARTRQQMAKKKGRKAQAA